MLRNTLLRSIAILGVSVSIAHATEMEQYTKVGVINCALPGTTITFAANGSGGAIVISASSNYAPFRQAAKVKIWSAQMVNQSGKRLLVLDNLNKTRIMVDPETEKGMAFAPSGVSDILCQIVEGH